MPPATLKPCSHQPCANLTRSGGPCPAHALERGRARGSAAARGYDRRHQAWRKMILARNPICVVCYAKGSVTKATVADHIVPLAKGGGWALTNGQGLCESHHNAKTARENA